MDFTVACVDGGVVRLVNLTEFDTFTIPTNLMPGLKAGEVVSLKIEKKDGGLQDQILRLQDDISVFFRTRQK